MITLAIQNLRPGAHWALNGNTYDGLDWLDEVQSKPTVEELSEEVARIQHQNALTAYKRQRAAEYPPITDYLDGVVKGDQTQIDAYIASCQAVKTKYPKPESV